MNITLILIIFIVIIVNLVVICNKTEEAINIFFNSVTDPNNLNLNNAQNALYKLNHNDLNRFGDTAPLLHHFLNLYRLSNKTYDKKKIIEIMLYCLYLGFDSHSTYKNDPPLLFKSIILKELNLTKSIIENNPASVYKMILHQKQWLKDFICILYSIPSEYVVPLAKLLLHVDTITGNRNQTSSMEEIKYLLESADLGKPTVKPTDLALYSTTYHTILSSIGMGFPIKLVDIVRSLDEVAGSIHQALLDVLIDILHDEGTDWEIIISYIETLTAATMVVTNNTVGLSPLPYPMGRNPLHYLCISGGSIMLQQLTKFIQRIILAISEEEETLSLELSVAAEKDLILSIFRTALISKDMRGHSPISYAVMRYSQNSVIFDELKSLCNLLLLDIEVLLLEFPWIQTHYNSNSNVMNNIIADQNNVISGGWSTIKKELPQHYMDNSCDIMEVYEKSLPNNKEFFVNYVNRGVPVIFRQVALSDSPTKSTKYSDNMKKIRKVFQKDNFMLNYGSFRVPSATIPYSGKLLFICLHYLSLTLTWRKSLISYTIDTFGIKSSISTLAEVANSDKIILKSGKISLNGNMDVDELNNNTLPLYTFCTPSQQWSSKLLGDIPIPRSIYRDLSSSSYSSNVDDNNNNADSGIGLIDEKYSSWSFELQFYLGSAGTGAPIHFHGHALNTLAYGEKVVY